MTTTRPWWAGLQLAGLRVFCIALIALNSFRTRTRMSHQNGIVACGRVRIVDDLAVPENDFFRPGREFPCRLRHASVSLMDDAGLFVRGASLKFADADIDSPLDLLMNGGTASPFWNMYTFTQFMFARVRGGRAHLIPYFQDNTRCFENTVTALRLHPTSFSQLRYHSQTPFEFRARDGRRRYCKFRLIPEDRGPETGIPDEDDLRTPWFQEAHPGDKFSPNYPKDEFRERVRTRGVTYHLEMQLHEWQPGDERAVVLNSLYAWDEASHPWIPLATVQIDAIHEADPYGLRCTFPMTNQPECMGLIEPLSIHDPPSLEYLRVGSSFAHRARMLGMKLLGAPEPVPDVRPVVTCPDEAMCHVTADEICMDARLPQNETKPRRRTRAQQLEQARGRYQFTGDDTLPAYVKDLPTEEAFSPDKERRMLWDMVATVAELGLGGIELEFDPSRNLRAYDDFFGGDKLPLPPVSARYASDEEFGRQRLDGVNPFLLRRCDALPDHFPVKQADVASLLTNGSDLASLRTHMVMETIAVATHRQLSIAHPLHQLLVPHCRFTMAINHSARTKMLAPGGPIDKTMGVGWEGAPALGAKAWKDWSFTQYDLRSDLKARGVDDPRLLPGYHYRDDALTLWDATGEFAGAVLRRFYHSDADVAADTELQAWVRELVDPEIGNFRGFADHAGGLGSVERLVHVATTIVFIATAEHSGTNNGQYEMYAYIPNVPGSIFAAPPTTKTALTERSLFESLPHPRTAAEQIGMVHLLSERTEAPVGTYAPGFFAGNPEIEPLVARFETALHAIGEAIDARNNRIAVPYTCLHPALVYPSIEI